jgi:hypothetical protein
MAIAVAPSARDRLETLMVSSELLPPVEESPELLPPPPPPPPHPDNTATNALTRNKVLLNFILNHRFDI